MHAGRGTGSCIVSAPNKLILFYLHNDTFFHYSVHRGRFQPWSFVQGCGGGGRPKKNGEGENFHLCLCRKFVRAHRRSVWWAARLPLPSTPSCRGWPLSSCRASKNKRRSGGAAGVPCEPSPVLALFTAPQGTPVYNTLIFTVLGFISRTFYF